MITKEEIMEVVKKEKNFIFYTKNMAEILAKDIFDIVNNGKKYPPRGETEEERFPEDISTVIALQVFHINAYIPFF